MGLTPQILIIILQPRPYPVCRESATQTAGHDLNLPFTMAPLTLQPRSLPGMSTRILPRNAALLRADPINFSGSANGV